MLKKESTPYVTMYLTQRDIRHNPHRPAIKYSNEKVYYLNGKLQNIVGPSRSNSNTKFDTYQINGIVIGRANHLK